MIEFMAAETEEEVAVEKIIRLGAKHKQMKENPRSVIVTFTNIEGKRSFLRNAKNLKNSDDEIIKTLGIANDLTKKDIEKEAELVTMKMEKKLSGGGSLE